MNPTNGLLLIDKPSGMTSHDVVGKVRRILGIRAIGHAGTLDPLASGLLVLLIGEATKISDYLLNGDKGYELKAQLGLATDSLDITGQVISEKPVTASPEKIRETALSLQGALNLSVPVHSAVKVDGKRLYKFAHKGETPENVPVREMSFYDLDVVEVNAPKTGEPSEIPAGVTIRMRCSKGSFVRAWVGRLGEDLGCGATVTGLRRLYSAPLEVTQAVGLDELERRWSSKEERHGRVLGPAWVPLAETLPHFKRIAIGGQDEVLLKNGQISKGVQGQLLQGCHIGEAPPPVKVVSLETGDLLALLLAEPGQFYRIKRVFNKV
jgi:tRNA pseudouridine55 synthase